MSDVDVTIASQNNQLHSVAERRAKRLLERVQKGETLASAADHEHMRLSDIRRPGNPVGESLKQLVTQYFLPPEARRQMVRAGLNKTFLEGINSDDKDTKKLALDAAKMIAADPEVGLQQEQGGGVFINIGELSDVFAQLRQSPPEVNDGRQSEDRTIEAEHEPVALGGGSTDSVSDVPE